MERVKVKLLIVTETASIHAARWVNQLKHTGWEVHVFQAMASHSLINPEFCFGVLHVPLQCPVPKGVDARFTLGLGSGVDTWMERIEKKQPGALQAVHEEYLTKLIEQLKPDVIHSLGLNINWTNICLPVLRVRQEL